MIKPRFLIALGGLFLGGVALQTMLTRTAESAPQAKTKPAVKTAAKTKAAPKAKVTAKNVPKIAAVKAVAVKAVAVKAVAAPLVVAAPAPTMPIYNFKLETLDGKPADLAKYKGQVVMIVNTASKCGNTPQYAGLQALSEKYKAQGLRVLGFPANNFGGQEPGSNAEIGTFCQKNYGVTFDMFAKTSVKGDDQSPLFKYLTTEANPELTGDIDWNFAKFLISRDGKLVARFQSRVQPDSEALAKALETELAKK